MDLENLWSPAAFSRTFGEDKHTIVNTRTGKCIPNMPLKKFWDGFENLSKRMTDEMGRNMLLKLKDWPPDNDFALHMPQHFDDLMKCIPLVRNYGCIFISQVNWNLISRKPFQA